MSLTVNNVGTYAKELIWSSDADIYDFLTEIDTNLRNNSWGKWDGTSIDNTQPHYNFEDTNYIRKAYASRTIMFDQSNYTGTGLKYIMFEYDKTGKILKYYVPESVNSSTGAMVNNAGSYGSISFTVSDFIYFFYHKNWILFGKAGLTGLLSLKSILNINYNYPPYLYWGGGFNTFYFPKNIFNQTVPDYRSNLFISKYCISLGFSYSSPMIMNSTNNNIDPYTNKKICSDIYLLSSNSPFDVYRVEGLYYFDSSFIVGMFAGIKYGGTIPEATGNIYYKKIDLDGFNVPITSNVQPSKMFSVANFLIPIEIYQ